LRQQAIEVFGLKHIALFAPIGFETGLRTNTRCNTRAFGDDVGLDCSTFRVNYSIGKSRAVRAFLSVCFTMADSSLLELSLSVHKSAMAESTVEELKAANVLEVGKSKTAGKLGPVAALG
jgi:hypothetical protein